MSLYALERDGDVPELLTVLREADDPQVRARAAEMLGGFGGTEEPVVDGLVEAVESDDSETVRTAAVDALDALGRDALRQLIVSIGSLDVDEERAQWAVTRAYVEVLSADLPELRMAAASAIGHVDEDGAASELAEALVDALEDPDSRVRARAARACGRLGHPGTTAPLADATSDATAAVRREAAEALGEIGGRDALDALDRLVDDEAVGVRLAAVNALGSLDTTRPIDRLVEALDDEFDRVRRAAVYSVIELLSSAPENRSHEIREEVVDALTATDDESVVAPLAEMLEESTQASRRRNAAWLLGRVVGGEPRRSVVDALIDALDDDDQLVAQFAATSLTEIGDERIEGSLIAALDVPEISEQGRAMIVFVLGKVGGENASKRIDDLVDDTESELVRKKAFAALSRLGGREAPP